MAFIELSEDQRQAMDAILAWLKKPNGRDLLTLGGFAGTGKSTLVSLLASQRIVTTLAFCTFTGKASSVLRKKLRVAGVETTQLTRTIDRHGDESMPVRGGPPYCSTIHSLIYRPVVDEHGNVIDFVLREELDREYDLLIVDEASMVSDEMLDELRSFRVPILAVGDHAQLAPVSGLGSLMQEPDIRLEKIHRQAEENPIIRLSKVIRETGRFDTKLASKEITFGRRLDTPKIIERRYSQSDIDLFDYVTLCYTNKTRIAINDMIRRAMKRNGPPSPGEMLICLRNLRERSIYNGMRCLVGRTHGRGQFPWQIDFDLNFVEDEIEARLSCCARQFRREKTFSQMAELQSYGIRSWKQVGALMDFGAACTVHKFQGSGCDHVLFIAETSPYMEADEQRRFLYTGVTRAAQSTHILS